MICERHRCVFIHVPKTAGTSLSISLGWIAEDSETYGSHDHRTVAEYRAAMNPEAFQSYFKFAFVRNPWDRAVSWYKNLVEDPFQSARFGIGAGACTFAEYISEHSNSWTLRPQLDWLRDESGTLTVDFVGRYERLQADYAFVRARLGLTPESLPQRAGAEDTTAYRHFYTPETKKRIIQLFGEDIEMFGYEFSE